MKSFKHIFFSLSLVLLVALFPAKAFAADPAIGNEVVNTADSTLTRSGAGTAANPYKLQLNLNNPNTWSAVQTLNNALIANGIVNLGDGGDAVSISGSTVTLSANGGGNDITANLVDNNTDAFDVQQGGNNYINVSTADLGEFVTFGNTTTNPNYAFLGNGLTELGGDIIVDGGDVRTSQPTASLFDTSISTLNIGGTASTVNIGDTTGTATVRNTTFSLPNATAINAAGATANVDSVNVGGGYGSTGTTVSSIGNIATNGDVTVDGNMAVNGGDITSTAFIATLFNTNVGILNIGGAANNITLGNNWGFTFLNGNLMIQGDSTSFGGVTFSPNFTQDFTINTDSDSFLTLNGLSTASGDPLCIDGSNNVIKCAGAFSAASAKENTSLEETVKAQQAQIDQLKKEVEELKAAPKP